MVPMSGIPIGAWGAIIIVSAAMGTALIYLLKTWLDARKSEAMWSNLGLGGLKYIPRQVDAGKLSVAASKAIDALCSLGPWSANQVVSSVSGWKIYVRMSPTWIDAYGRKIAGDTLSGMHTIEVGNDLAALAHEFAHVCELMVDKQIDDMHVNWGKRGLFAAADKYQESIK